MYERALFTVSYTHLFPMVSPKEQSLMFVLTLMQLMMRMMGFKMCRRDRPVPMLRMADVELTSGDWLWFPYIPFGKLTIIQGNPGEGKTYFATVSYTHLDVYKRQPPRWSSASLP